MAEDDTRRVHPQAKHSLDLGQGGTVKPEPQVGHDPDKVHFTA
jgi:hypothetical protein